MFNAKDFVERALALFLVVLALSGIAFGVATMTSTNAALGIG